MRWNIVLSKGSGVEVADARSKVLESGNHKWPEAHGWTWVGSQAGTQNCVWAGTIGEGRTCRLECGALDEVRDGRPWGSVILEGPYHSPGTHYPCEVFTICGPNHSCRVRLDVSQCPAPSHWGVPSPWTLPAAIYQELGWFVAQSRTGQVEATSSKASGCWWSEPSGFQELVLPPGAQCDCE